MQSFSQDIKRTQDITATHTGVDGKENFDGSNRWPCGARRAYRTRCVHLRDVVEIKDDGLAFILIKYCVVRTRPMSFKKPARQLRFVGSGNGMRGWLASDG